MRHSITEVTRFLEKLFNRITEQLRLEGTCGGYLVQAPCSSRDT